MNSLWVIHLVECIKTEKDTQGRDLWVDLHNNIVANTDALIIYIQVEGTVMELNYLVSFLALNGSFQISNISIKPCFCVCW